MDDKKNKPPVEAVEDFKKSQLFVITRASDGESASLTIQTANTAKKVDELEQLYHTIFFDVVLNLGGLFPKNRYHQVLNIVTPAIAQMFFDENPEKAQEVVTDFLDQETDKKTLSFIKNMPDSVSALHFVLNSHFYNFYNIKKSKGLDVALNQMHQFYNDMEVLFFKLPACYCFVLSDLASEIKK